MEMRLQKINVYTSNLLNNSELMFIFFRVNYLNYRTPLCVVIFVLRRFKTDENSNKHNSSTSTKQTTNVLTLRDFQILQPSSQIKRKPLPQHPENKAILNPHPPNERAQPVSEQPCGSDR